MNAYREMDAKYASGCDSCPYGVLPGERIRTTGTGWGHVDCAVTVSKREGGKPSLYNPKASDGGATCATCDQPVGAHRKIGAYPVYCPTSRPTVPKAPALPETGLDISGLEGLYAVETESGLAFLRVDAPSKGKWDGWRFVKRQAGPNFDRVGSQRPGGTYRGQWAGLISKAALDPEAAMRRYGIELGHCGRCGLELTDEASRAYGIGPVCRDALGW